MAGMGMDLDPTLPLVSRYTQTSATDAQRANVVEELSGLIAKGDCTVLAVVAALQDCLTSEDSSARVLGTLLLAQVLQRAGAALTTNDLHHLALFMSSRLSDWPCTEPAAEGCTALLRLTPSRPAAAGGGPRAPAAAAAGAALTEADAVAVMRAAAEELAGQVQQLAQKERSASLTLLLVGTQEWGLAAARANINLVEACIASIDGEKDPRCLLTAFKLVQAVASVYHSPGVSPSFLEDQAEEVIEVLSCYFPLTFNPPKADPHKITRAELASSLTGSMACSPFLVKWAMPLVLEKLSSTYRPAKDDALAALTACCEGRGKEAVMPHIGTVWSALRTEIMGPASFGLNSGEDLATARQLSDQAALCLTRCTAALGPASGLPALVTQDTVTQELLASVRGAAAQGPGPRPEGSDPGRPDRQLICAAMALGAVAAGGTWAAQHVMDQVLAPLLKLLPPTALPATVQPPAALPAGSQQPVGQQPAQAAWGSHRSLYCFAACHHVLQQMALALQQNTAAAGGGDGRGGGGQAGLIVQALQGLGAQLGGSAVAAIDALTPQLSGGALEVEGGDGALEQETALQTFLAACASVSALCTLHSLESPSSETAGLLNAALISHFAGSVTRVALAVPPAQLSYSPLTREVATRMQWSSSAVPVDAAMAVVALLLRSAVGSAVSAEAVETVGSEEPTVSASVQQVVLSQLMAVLCGCLGTATATVTPAGTLQQSAPPQDNTLDMLTAASAAGGKLSWRRALHVCGWLAGEVPTFAVALLGALAHLVPGLMAVGNETLQPSETDLTGAWWQRADACKELLHLIGTCLEAARPVPLPPASSRAACRLACELMRCTAPAPAPASASSATPASVQVLDVLAAAAVVAGRISASCTPEDQTVLVSQAVQQLTVSLQSTPSIESVDVVGCAVVAGSAPGALAADQAQPLCTLLLAACTMSGAEQQGQAASAGLPHTQGASLQAPGVQGPGTAAVQGIQGTSRVRPLHRSLRMHAAAVALASVLNKLADTNDLDCLGRQVLGTLGIQTQLQQQQQLELQATPEVSQAASGELLAWVTAALARRGSPLVGTVMSHVVQQLALLPPELLPPSGPQSQDVVMTDPGLPQSNQPAEQQQPQQEQQLAGLQVVLQGAAVAQVVFGSTSVTGLHGSGGITWHHVQARPLWQQRTLQQLLPPLLKQRQQQSSKEPPQGLHVLLAMLLASLPVQLLRPHLPQLVLLMRDCLAALQRLWLHLQHTQAQATQSSEIMTVCQQLGGFVQQGMLGVVAVVGHEAAQPLMEKEVAALLPLLCTACRLQGNAAVREASLKLLTALHEGLPYHVLHPHRAQVIATVVSALDDNRRSVRQAAVSCRRLWSRV